MSLAIFFLIRYTCLFGSSKPLEHEMIELLDNRLQSSTWNDQCRRRLFIVILMLCGGKCRLRNIFCRLPLRQFYHIGRSSSAAYHHSRYDVLLFSFPYISSSHDRSAKIRPRVDRYPFLSSHPNSHLLPSTREFPFSFVSFHPIRRSKKTDPTSTEQKERSHTRWNGENIPRSDLHIESDCTALDSTRIGCQGISLSLASSFPIICVL